MNYEIKNGRLAWLNELGARISRKGAIMLKVSFSVVNTNWYITVALTPRAFTTPTSNKATPPATTLYSIDVAPD
jgi:hypothetical protein